MTKLHRKNTVRRINELSQFEIKRFYWNLKGKKYSSKYTG